MWSTWAHRLGGSGPWPMAIGPQDSAEDERLYDIVVERNRFMPDYGTQSCCSSPPTSLLEIFARRVTVRNNIFSGAGTGGYFSAVNIGQRGPGQITPRDVRVLNNTIYKSTNPDGGYVEVAGIRIDATATRTAIKNNLVHFSFPYTNGTVEMISNSSADLQEGANLLTDASNLADPDNADPLLRDFSLTSASPVIDQGEPAPVFDDFSGAPRSDATLDIGAHEQ